MKTHEVIFKVIHYRKEVLVKSYRAFKFSCHLKGKTMAKGIYHLLAVMVVLNGCITGTAAYSERSGLDHFNRILQCQVDRSLFENPLWDELSGPTGKNQSDQCSDLFHPERPGVIFVDMDRNIRKQYYNLAGSFLKKTGDGTEASSVYRTLLELYNPCRVYCTDRAVVIIYPSFDNDLKDNTFFPLICIRPDGNVLLHKKGVPAGYLFNGEADFSNELLKVTFVQADCGVRYDEYHLDNLISSDKNIKQVETVVVNPAVFHDKLWEHLANTDLALTELSERGRLGRLLKASPSIEMTKDQGNRLREMLFSITEGLKAEYEIPRPYFDPYDFSIIVEPSVDEILLTKIKKVYGINNRRVLIFQQLNALPKHRTAFWIIAITDKGEVEAYQKIVPAGYVCTDISMLHPNEFTATMRSLTNTLTQTFILSRENNSE